MADTDEKIYHAEVIQEVPFPGQIGDTIISDSQKPNQQIFTQQIVKDQGFPTKKVAQELLSSALNTRSKKVLAEFQFAPSGALQIGNQETDISGDIRISPDGIVARNKKGENTIVIDGDTGDVFIKGNLLAGSIISESSIKGGTIDIGGEDAESFHVDGDGNLWTGAIRFADAPFSVDKFGNLIATSATFGQFLSKAGASQVLAGSILVGTGAGGSSVLIDGANNRILINDGTNNRIVIGNV